MVHFKTLTAVASLRSVLHLPPISEAYSISELTFVQRITKAFVGKAVSQLEKPFSCATVAKFDWLAGNAETTVSAFCFSSWFFSLLHFRLIFSISSCPTRTSPCCSKIIFTSGLVVAIDLSYCDSLTALGPAIPKPPNRAGNANKSLISIDMAVCPVRAGMSFSAIAFSQQSSCSLATTLKTLKE